MAVSPHSVRKCMATGPHIVRKCVAVEPRNVYAQRRSKAATYPDGGGVHGGHVPPAGEICFEREIQPHIGATTDGQEFHQPLGRQNARV